MPCSGERAVKQGFKSALLSIFTFNWEKNTLGKARKIHSLSDDLRRNGEKPVQASAALSTKQGGDIEIVIPSSTCENS